MNTTIPGIKYNWLGFNLKFLNHMFLREILCIIKLKNTVTSKPTRQPAIIHVTRSNATNQCFSCSSLTITIPRDTRALFNVSVIFKAIPIQIVNTIPMPSIKISGRCKGYKVIPTAQPRMFDFIKL